MLVANSPRRGEALVGMRGWHSNVDNCCVGACKADVVEQLFSVLGLGGDVDLGGSQKAHNALAGEHDVVGNDYAHGISARSRVGSTTRIPPRAPTRSASMTIDDVRLEPLSSTVTTSRLSSWMTLTAAWSAPRRGAASVGSGTGEYAGVSAAGGAPRGSDRPSL